MEGRSSLSRAVKHSAALEGNSDNQYQHVDEPVSLLSRLGSGSWTVRACIYITCLLCVEVFISLSASQPSVLLPIFICFWNTSSKKTHWIIPFQELVNFYPGSISNTAVSSLFSLQSQNPTVLRLFSTWHRESLSVPGVITSVESVPFGAPARPCWCAEWMHLFAGEN